MMLKKYIPLILLTVLTGQLTAQFSEEYNHYKALYPDEDKIRLNIETNVNIEIVNNKIEIILAHKEEDLYLNATASYFSKESINYSTFFELININASSFIFEKNKYKELKVKDFKHKDDLSGSAFYDDSKSVNFIYSKLKEGAKSKLNYKQKIKDPHFLNSFYFGSFFPVINSTFTITADKNISLTFKEFNTDSIGLNFSKDEKNGKIIYRWTAKNVKKYEPESNSTNFRNTIAHLIPIITSYSIKNEKINLLNNVGGLYAWYYQLVKNINNEDADPELIKIVNSLIIDKKTELEKVKAIYYWVQQNIKYVAFEYALGGFVPREANDVFNKKYGDCKDNSSILQEMFKIAKIQGNLTWIGTRSIPYTYEKIPTPASDNHMILTYITDSNMYFLDATGRFYPLGLPTSFIQGKEALIAIDSNNYLIKEVPIIEAEKNFFTDSVQLNIHNQQLTGKGLVKVNGYPKIDYYNILEQQKTNDDIKEFYNFNFRKGSNKFLINDFKESNKYDYEKDFIIDYSFQVDNYISNTDNEIYINLNLSKDILDYKVKKDDQLDKEFKYKNYSNYKYILTIPDGYHVEYLPENITIEDSTFKSHIKYVKQKNTIVYEHDIKLDFIVLKQENHKMFNDFLDQLDKAYKESIVLKKDIN